MKLEDHIPVESHTKFLELIPPRPDQFLWNIVEHN